MARIAEEQEAAAAAVAQEADVIMEAAEAERAVSAGATEKIFCALPRRDEYKPGRKLTMLQEPLDVQCADPRLGGRSVTLIRFLPSVVIAAEAGSEPVRKRYEIRPWNEDGDYSGDDELASMIPFSPYGLADFTLDPMFHVAGFPISKFPVLEAMVYRVQVNRFRELAAALAMSGGVDLAEVPVGQSA